MFHVFPCLLFPSFCLTSKIAAGRVDGRDAYMVKRDINQFDLEF